MKRLSSLFLVLTLLLIIGALGFLPTTTVEAQANVPWTGIFYSTTNFENSPTSVVVSYPAGLNQNWGAGPPTDPVSGQPLVGIPADNFSARFTANTTIAAGLYEFIVLGDGGVRLTINGNTEVINDLGTQGPVTRSAIVNIGGGQTQLTLEYIEFTGNAFIQINWIPSTGTPSASTTSDPGFGVVNVVTVRGLALRTGPFLGASLVGVARPGVDYPVLARNIQEGLFTWYFIQFDIDTQGWVSGRYLTFTTGTPDAAPIVDSTNFDTIYDPPGQVIGLTRSVMNFRVHPTQRSARIAAVPQLIWGAQVEILARTVQGGSDFWYQVRYTVEDGSASYVGWIFAPFVGIQAGSDPIDTVPIL